MKARCFTRYQGVGTIQVEDKTALLASPRARAEPAFRAQFDLDHTFAEVSTNREAL